MALGARPDPELQVESRMNSKEGLKLHGFCAALYHRNRCLAQTRPPGKLRLRPIASLACPLDHDPELPW